MKRQGKKRGGEPLNYWQSTADMMSALLLILLLVIMLLLLYIIQIPEEEYIDLYPGSYSSSAASDSDGGWGGGSSEGGYWPDDWDGWGGGGWGGGGGDGDYQYQIPAGGGGTGYGDGFGKTAVYVMMVDAETDATIKEAGVDFELYTYDGGIQFLNTYYPQRIEYRQYETTEEGVFYLPEKIFQGHYYFHELTEPEGYDSAGNIEFFADEDRDWDEPLIVTVPLSPSKNIIRIQMTDADTGGPVAGGVYDVIAAEDIITKDGTLRYRAGQTVDQITCDEEGYGESIELYLGDYTLVQSTIPPYYAADDGEPLEVSVEKKQNDVLPPLHRIRCEKTTVTIHVTDELYPDIGLDNVSFRVTKSGDGTTTVTATEDGQLVLTDLDKGVTYRLRQLTSAEDYQFSTSDFVFSVSADGRVEEEAQKDYTITNRLVRVRVSVVDRVLRSNVSDYNVALYDSDSQLTGVWDSTGLAQSLEGLEPGIYYLVLDGKTNSRKAIEIQDIAEVQEIRVPVWTLTGIGILAAGIAILAGVIALLYHWKKTHPAPRIPSRALLAAVARAKALRQSRKEAEDGQDSPESGQLVTTPAPESSAESEPSPKSPEPDSSDGSAPADSGANPPGGKKRRPFWKRKKPDDPAGH